MSASPTPAIPTRRPQPSTSLPMSPALARSRTPRRATLAACLAAILATGAVSPLPAAPGERTAPAAARQQELLRRQLFSTERPQRIERPQRPATVSGGTTRPVTTCADDGSPGSLREIAAAAGNGDTVDLRALTCSRITLSGGEIVLGADDVSVIGPGRDALTIDGDGRGRVLFHQGEGRLAVSALALANGVIATGSEYEGGCLRSYGDVELDAVTISGCRISDALYGIGAGVRALGSVTAVDTIVRDSHILVHGAAGASAISAEHDVTLIDSRITGNTVAVSGENGYGYIYFGAVNLWGHLSMTRSTVSGNRSYLIDENVADSFVWGGGVTTHGSGVIVASTIDDNHARDLGGGVTIDGPLGLTIVSSTISGNSAAKGGGILVRPLSRSVAIRNSTITGNGAQSGGGIYFDEPYDPLLLELQSTILAGNTAPAGADIGKRDRLTIYGASNLVLSVPADVVLPVDTLRVAPGLAPLADNGGPTRTHALAVNSPARDAGNDYFALGTDQRGPGHPRIAGADADIGSFEAPVNTDAIFTSDLEAGSD